MKKKSEVNPMTVDTSDMLKSIFDTFSGLDYIRPEDIPNIDLYMDQVTTFMEEHLKKTRRHPGDKILTKTMINNYSKAKVITPVKGKKYTKEQIIQMLIIYQLKNNLSIQEIKDLLTPIYENNDDLSNLYDHFIDIKHSLNSQLQKMIQKIMDDYQLKIENYQDLFLLVAILSSLSHSLTNIAEMLIETKEI